jgi:hypothetical protein
VPYSVPLGDEAVGVVVLPVPFMANDFKRLRMFCDYMDAAFADEMGGTDSPAGASVPAVDPSRSIPDKATP